MDSLWLKVTIPIVVAVLAWVLKTSKERKSVGVAIHAEMSALVEIARVRKYQDGLLEAATELQRLSTEERLTIKLFVPIPKHYCRVYTGNIQHLGLLDADEAPIVVRFYQYLDSVVRDISEGGILFEGSDDPEPFADAHWMIGKAFDLEIELTQLRNNKREAPWYKRLWRIVG
ncbi:hypothetical protein CU664_14405 [Pseudomonas syringae pv. actinidifoliorum]|uniref:hypothetical protein n=1 Tax=Pseudomonas syringae TaxID=317 RepID=UPI001373190C|nr:hypothetical protein [Pseudomonas syringae]NAS95179.1 hypothetical protein [Pseudomonas syringae pv. actinidifoliorum]NAT64394.1 hypothetical protein [Pseudomonas syringae pv. actinidifoliorum]